MASSIFPDPLQFWRDALTKLESEVNSLANGSIKTPQVTRSLHQLSSASLGLQQLAEKAIAAALRRAHLPSRKDVVDLADALRRIEDKLDRLLHEQAPEPAVQPNRPARTRRPPSEAAPMAAAAVPPAAAAAPPAGKRASGKRAAAKRAAPKVPVTEAAASQRVAAKRRPARRQAGGEA